MIILCYLSPGQFFYKDLHQIWSHYERIIIQYIKMEPIPKQFFKYPSIENSYNVKAVSFTKKAPVANKQVVWAALQKIHGANFSIEVTDNTAKYCRRKDYVSTPIPIPCEDVIPYFTQKFFNCQNLVSKIHNKLEDITKVLSTKFPDMKKFYIFGEYFGGHWPGVLKEGISHVQKGIYYSPDHHFYIFDCLVVDQRWLSVKQLNEQINPIIPTVPIYKTGTFEELLEINAVFNSTIPALLNLEMKQKNTCQGVVIRPYEQPKHVIYKIKNDEFLEITNTPIPKKQKQEEKQFKQGQHTLEALLKYVNKNRVASAYSKMPNAKIDAFSQEVLHDVLDEAKNQEVKLPEDQKVKDRLIKTLRNKICMEIVTYLKEVREEKVDIQEQKEILKNEQELDEEKDT